MKEGNSVVTLLMIIESKQIWVKDYFKCSRVHFHMQIRRYGFESMEQSRADSCEQVWLKYSY